MAGLTEVQRRCFRAYSGQQRSYLLILDCICTGTCLSTPHVQSRRQSSPMIAKESRGRCSGFYADSPRVTLVMFTSAADSIGLGIILRQTRGYLFSCWASPPFGRYKFIPLGTQARVWTTSLRLLPESGHFESRVQRPHHYITRPHNVHDRPTILYRMLITLVICWWSSKSRSSLK